MMEEKKGLVDFLRSTVTCFKDVPRGHIINLAQHMQQVCLLVLAPHPFSPKPSPPLLSVFCLGTQLPPVPHHDPPTSAHAADMPSGPPVFSV